MIDAGLSCDLIIDATQNNPIDYTGYFQVKYQNFKAFAGTNINGGNEHDEGAEHAYIRYADVLLMLAEALHRGSGDDGSAMAHIDAVRERAAGPGDNAGVFRTASQLMADEGMSLLDVICTSAARSSPAKATAGPTSCAPDAESSLFVGDGDKEGNFDDESLWFPIALEETVIANSMTTYPDASF